MKVTVVYGPPCSGKSTWAAEKVEDDDAVYDYDRILAAISNRDDRPTTTHAAHKFVIGFRESFLRRLEFDESVKTAYFITRYPDSALKEKLKGFDPEYHLMDASLDECLERLEKDDTRPDKSGWEEIIRRWFKDHDNEKDKRKEIIEENKKYLGGIQ